jgi:hypothetical protein
MAAMETAGGSGLWSLYGEVGDTGERALPTPRSSRKRGRNPSSWKTNAYQRRPLREVTECECERKCLFAVLSEEEVESLRCSLHEAERQVQRQLLFDCIETRRSRGGVRLVVSFFVLHPQRGRIELCRKAFMLIFSVSQKVIGRLLKDKRTAGGLVAPLLQFDTDKKRGPREPELLEQIVERNNVMCCTVFGEDLSSQGQNATYSLLLDHLSTSSRKGEWLILWTDSCARQNKHYMAVHAMQSLIEQGERKRIDLKFPVVGHSFLPCDRIFGLIEKRRHLNKDIYIPEQWKEIVEGAAASVDSVDIRFEFVEDVTTFKHLDAAYKQVFSLSACRKVIGTQPVERVNISEMFWINFGFGEEFNQATGTYQMVPHPEEVWFKKGHDRRAAWIKCRWRPRAGFSVPDLADVPPANTEKRPLKPEKIADLLKMKEYVPERYHWWYPAGQVNRRGRGRPRPTPPEPTSADASTSSAASVDTARMDTTADAMLRVDPLNEDPATPPDATPPRSPPSTLRDTVSQTPLPVPRSRSAELRGPSRRTP